MVAGGVAVIIIPAAIYHLLGGSFRTGLLRSSIFGSLVIALSIGRMRQKKLTQQTNSKA
jgi:ABC-type Mn2+/Zn2+ transport system permease subunit